MSEPVVKADETEKAAMATNEQKSLAELVLENRKRTFRMFATDHDEPIKENDSLIKMKIKSKVVDNYSKLGEIPGVLVDKVGREKILKELGLPASGQAAASSLAAEA